MFYSASMGLLARETGPKFGSVSANQALGLLIGFIGMFVAYKIPYKFWKKTSFILFVISIIVNLIVFIPGIGFEHGGAIRWINIKGYTLQPSEFLKFAYIIYLAAWLTKIRSRVGSIESVTPFLLITGIVATVLYFQKDADTTLIMASTGLIMFFAAGARIKHLIILLVIGAMCLGILVLSRPYILERIKDYLGGTLETAKSYQVEQSLIAIGSGGMFGKGFGQSIQKFGYLPEPIGDSIFSIQAEEFGFFGSTILIILFLIFIFRSLKISSKTPDTFSRLVVVGIAILIVAESFMNMSAMLGIIPLSGLPLLFVSHGGTALAVVLFETGIILNISKS